MEKLIINPPVGYEIDQDKSDLSNGIVEFKEVKKELTYEDICKKLFKDEYYYINNEGNLSSIPKPFLSGYNDFDSNNSATTQQLESILALNMLCNVAKYLNDGWLPTPTVCDKYIIIISVSNRLIIDYHTQTLSSHVYFKTKELAKQAIIILGEDVIRKALTLNH